MMAGELDCDSHRVDDLGCGFIGEACMASFFVRASPPGARCLPCLPACLQAPGVTAK